ncbi:MAG: hypothetical protein AAGD43_05710 [Pseudomonadota bacterium]
MEKLKELLPALVADANLAPSVHNIQPSRWRLNGDQLQMLGDTTRSIPIADPANRDWRLSHGAQFEGMEIALNAAGYGFEAVDVVAPQDIASNDRLAEIVTARVVRLDHLTTAAGIDLKYARRRQSWRGSFRPVDQAATDALSQLSTARPECAFVTGHDDLREVASLYDAASIHFLRDEAHRDELLGWMRLGTSHASYRRDGLNSVALNLGAVEAWAAGLILGPLFRALDSIGLASLLLSEAGKNETAAAIVLMPRPRDEDPFDTGRHFYRLWLDFERYGFQACPMSVLIDWDESRKQLEAKLGMASEQRFSAAFRIGFAKGDPAYRRARLPTSELIV